MAIVERRYKWVGHNVNEPIIGVTSMGNITDITGLIPNTDHRKVEYDNTLTTAADVDFNMKTRGWVYDP